MAVAKGISLHIGVNHVDPAHYGGHWDGALACCEKDCDDMRAIAQSQGFDTSVLKSPQATRDGVTSAIRESANQLTPGDFFLVSYSGHGGTIPDVDGDESDLVDETWCLFDGQLLDDELSVLWAGFEAGVRLLVISDSCHSGTMLKKVDLQSIERAGRGEPPSPDELFAVPRAMPRNTATDTARKNRQFYADLQYALPNPRPRIRATVRLLSGCREDELSWEGHGNGRFTAALKQTFAGGNFQGDYPAFHQAITELVKHKQHPNHAVHGAPSHEYDRQRPFTI